MSFGGEHWGWKATEYVAYSITGAVVDVLAATNLEALGGRAQTLSVFAGIIVLGAVAPDAVEWIDVKRRNWGRGKYE